MIKKLILILVVLFSIDGYCQRYRDFEYGPMLNYEHTSLYLDNGIFKSEKEGISNSGFEPNFAAGLYGIYYFRPRMGMGAELYYQRTSASDLKGSDHYNSLTFMPYVNFDPFRQVSGVYFGFGAGVAFIQEAPDYGSKVLEKDIRVVTIPVKVTTSYRIRNQVTFELGAQAEVFEVVRNQVRRNALFFGMKIPFNRVFINYR
ncbi:hypothetical protein [Christiangramia aquimixticola]|uniref:hypothetical protein n=1 Tax=Christiangramia aquimixticola TaxID=1697558 RepID=UPI003AA923A6